MTADWFDLLEGITAYVVFTVKVYYSKRYSAGTAGKGYV